MDIKQMSFSEKLKSIQRFEKNIKSYTSSLVKDQLGTEKLEELKLLWNKDFQPVPQNATDEEKYDVAYRNYMQTFVIAAQFMARNQGDHGIAEFNRVAIESMKRTGATPSNVLAKTLMTFAPKSSFQTIAKELAYRLQAYSPFTVDQLDENQMVLTLTPCKVASNSQMFCNDACKNVIRVWLEAQFNLKMVSDTQGTNCTVKISPFK